MHRLGVVAALVAVAVFLSAAVPAAFPAKIVPKAGTWKVTVKHGSGSGASGSFTVGRTSFVVSSNHKRVMHFTFAYTYSGPVKVPYVGPCSGTGVSRAAKSSRIKNLKFATPGSTSWSGAGSATFNGVFTTAKKAHGTARFSVFITGSGCQLSGTAITGTATWTARR